MKRSKAYAIHLYPSLYNKQRYTGYAHLHAIDIQDLDTQADLLSNPGRRAERQDRHHQRPQLERTGVVVGARRCVKE